MNTKQDMDTTSSHKEAATMNTVSITAAEVREGDIILSPRHNYRRYEVGAIEVQTEWVKYRYMKPCERGECDRRIFTWRPVGAARFHQGDCFDATDGILIEKA
jgi:hypothetical protein